MLRSVRNTPALQGQLPHPVPDPVWRRAARQPAAAPLRVPGWPGASHPVAAARPHPRPHRAGATVPGGALGVAGAVCRRGRPARRRAAGRLGRERHHPAPARPAGSRARRRRTREGAIQLHRRLPSGVGRAAGPGGAHRRRPRRRLCPGLGRQEGQLRTDRRPIHARGPRAALHRPGAWLRPQAETAAVRGHASAGLAGQPRCHVPDRRWRRGARPDRAGHPGSRARPRLLGWMAPASGTSVP